MAIKALFFQRRNGAKAGGITIDYPVDGRHRDGNQSRLRLDGAFLGSVALFRIGRTLSHPSHQFTGIEISAIGGPMKIGAGDCDTECTECFFRLLCLMK
jgi:hypothetical protein